LRLVRFGAPRQERPGLLDADNRLRDLSGVIADLDRTVLSPEGLARLAALDTSTLPEVDSSVRFGPCVMPPGKIVCVGLNYESTRLQVGVPRPDEPALSIKPSSALAGPFDGILLPKGSTATDWEVELAVVIGSAVQYGAERTALDHVAGYCLANDLSERDHQRSRGGESIKGRGHDGFAPLGPWLLTADEVPDPQDIDLWLEIDGQRIQQGSTVDMLWPVAALIAYVSQFMTLECGDVILSGTPAGIGVAQSPPRFLQPGETVRLGGSGLGEQSAIVRTGTDSPVR
jgi:2-keto-4-pentenoate hydratase/2-oxohepta-3-ene-1,7-dioic acid hydratase in catechol pathway